MATEAQIARLKKDWERYAKEPVSVEEVNGTFYGFCSELAAYRIYYKYALFPKDHRVIYSENLKSWVFVMEPTLNGEPLK